MLKSNKFSGAEHVVTDIITFMPEENSYYVSQKGPIEEVLKEKRIHYRMVDRLNRKSLLKIIREIDPDIIHAHDFTASFCVAFCFSGRPIISHLHKNAPWMKKAGLKSFAYLLSTMFYKKIFVVSGMVLEEFVFHRYVKGKTRVIGNPVNATEIRKKADEGMEKRNWEMVFVGRLSEPKNIPLLLDIMETLSKRMDNYRIVVVGEGEDESFFINEIKKRNLKDHVTMTGFQENPYPFMNHSKILVMPSKWEGFGLVAAEALVLGKPVVCSGAGGLDGIVDDSCGKKCGFDVMAYVNEIEKLLMDREYYRGKSIGAVIRAEKLDNMNSYIKKIRDIYDECTGFGSCSRL